MNAWSLRVKGHIGFIPAYLHQMQHQRLMHQAILSIELTFMGSSPNPKTPLLLIPGPMASHFGVDHGYSGVIGQRRDNNNKESIV